MMKTKTILLMSLLVLGITSQNIVNAQERVIPCSTDEHYLESVKKNPELLKIRDAMEAHIDQLQHFSARTNAEDTVTLTIPIVFHIIHNNGPEKLSKARIDQQIITLNNCFNKLNTDTAFIRPIFKGLIANAHIRFELAQKDPYGNCTNGIVEVVSQKSYNASDAVKAVSWWDNSKYLNIWVVRNIDKGAVPLGGIIAGYAQFPWDMMSRSSTDGIVMDYNFVKANDKTLVHEVGHYLGLLHTFQDGCSEDQVLQGDKVADTPPAAEANFGFNTKTNSCSTDDPDLPDMLENYMDYADRKYLFTPIQVWRMRAFLKSYRKELISQENLEYSLSRCYPASISDINHDAFQLNVYPNPANNILNISLNLTTTQNVSVELLDITGKSVYKENFAGMAGNNTFDIDVKNAVHSNGMYIVHITTANAVLDHKIFVTK